jgi:hypothetical protein
VLDVLMKKILSAFLERLILKIIRLSQLMVSLFQLFNYHSLMLKLLLIL